MLCLLHVTRSFVRYICWISFLYSYIFIASALSRLRQHHNHYRYYLICLSRTVCLWVYIQYSLRMLIWWRLLLPLCGALAGHWSRFCCRGLTVDGIISLERVDGGRTHVRSTPLFPFRHKVSLFFSSLCFRRSSCLLAQLSGKRMFPVRIWWAFRQPVMPFSFLVLFPRQSLWASF